MKNQIFFVTAGILSGFLLLCCHVSEKKTMTQTSDSLSGTLKSVKIDPDLKTPILIQYEKTGTTHRKSDKPDWQTRIEGILKTDPNLFQLNDPKEEITIKEIRSDEIKYTHVLCGRTHQGIEIWGDRLLFHFDSKGSLTSFQGRYHKTLPDSLPTEPKMDKESILPFIIQKHELDDQSTLTNPCKLIYFISDSVRLAWELDIEQPTALTGILYITDAETGAILHKDNKIRN